MSGPLGSQPRNLAKSWFASGSATGAADFTFPASFDRSLRGVDLTTQTAAFDASTQPSAVALDGALRLRIGDRERP